jgi:hypothetical protein
MTRSKLKEKISKVLGELHWANYHRKLKESGQYTDPDNLFGLSYDVPALHAELKDLLDRQRRRDFEEERNEFGNIIHRWFRSGAGRYHWDFGPCQEKFGWKQYDTDQDASYFGVWVHLERRLVLTYCEGDVSLVVCATDDLLRAQLQSMAEFYGPPPPAFICCTGIEARNGGLAPTGVTDLIYDERPAL